MGNRIEQLVDALASALVMADLSVASERRDFVAHAEKAVAEADQELVLSLLANEIRAGMEQLESGEIDLDAAQCLFSELISAALEAACTPQATATPGGIAAGTVTCYAADAGVVSEFVGGAVEQLDQAELLLSAAATGDEVDVHALFRCIHNLKGMSGFLSLDELAKASHETEAVLERVRSAGRSITEAEVADTLAAVDAMRAMVGGVDAPRQKTGEAQVQRVSADAQVRVNAARLEELLDAMGELAVAEAELGAAVKKSQDPESLRCLERLQRIARDMQGTATSLRMVSLKSTFSKMSRVVRDGLAKSNKAAELVISGEDTEIDRTIVEKLGDPLVHLLRNAMDHGIETSKERIAAGKAPVGRLDLRAFHRSGSVFIEIEDDGQGIQPERLIQRATELGIDYDREHPLSLIFHPGLSTSTEVTELSGRGVGMDAVSSAVAALRGQLDVVSEPGAGTRFTIRLPLTLAIIDGIVLRAGEDRYVVPTHFVERTAGVSASQIVSAAGSREVLVLPDGPVALQPITRTMGGTLETGDVAVVLSDGSERLALLVDEVIGQQSLVIKPLTGPTAAAAGPAGAALMGDGRVALVIDPAGLSRAIRGGW